MSANVDVVFLSAVRTPFGKFGGALKDLTATDLGVHAAKAAIERSGVTATAIDATVFGNVLQTSADAVYYARHVALRAGCRIETPALTVNRLCGSGFEAVVQGASIIRSGEAGICLVGGGESMSQAPFVARGIRFGIPLGANPPLVDSLTEALRDAYAGCAMADTAENLAEQYQLTRGVVDASRFAHSSSRTRRGRPACTRTRSCRCRCRARSRKVPRRSNATSIFVPIRPLKVSPRSRRCSAKTEPSPRATHPALAMAPRRW
jgi:acetyl-CoA acetyltransferase